MEKEVAPDQFPEEACRVAAYLVLLTLITYYETSR